MSSLSTFFNPKSIALIGASSNQAKIGGIVLNNLITGQYQGKIFPINPNETVLQDLKCYPKTSELPEKPDLAIIAIPNTKTIEVLEQLGTEGIKNVLIYTAGFKEIGSEGLQLEESLINVAKKHNLNILGPNCLGFVNNKLNLNATFGSVPKTEGNLKIISQSGAIATAFFDWCQVNNLGIQEFITIGNKSVINENDILQYWLENEDTSPIGLYLESISNGPKFLELIQKISQRQPIFIIKPGKSPEAASAMKSHTGSIAGADNVLQAVLKQANVISCATLSEFFNLSKTLSWSMPLKEGGIAVISNAGGPGVIASDAIAESKLKLAKLDEETEKRLSELLPRMSGLHNPIDVLGDALSDRFASALETVLPKENINSILVILTPQLMTEIQKTAQIIGALSQKHQKPIYCSFIGGKQVVAGEEILNEFKVPNFPYPEEAIECLEQIYLWQKNIQTGEAEESNLQNIDTESLHQLLNIGVKGNQKVLSPELTQEFLNLSQINAPSSIVTEDISIAENFALQTSWPVVLKTAMSDNLHKTESGGVRTNIYSISDLRKTWTELSTIDPKIQIQKQVISGVELIVGFKKDSVFGKTLFFGLGGKFVSLIHDQNISVFPVNHPRLQKLIESSVANKLLSGFRGDKPYDLQKILSIVLKLSYVFENCSEIEEMEINPLIVTHDGIWAVDTKVLLKTEKGIA